MTDILVTCPPMLGQLDRFRTLAAQSGLQLHGAEVTQTLSEEALIALLPRYDGWIIGDDPATRHVLTAGAQGRLRSVVKWGVGVDNVDRAACADLGLPFANTPGVFGEEVADVALAYVIALARDLFVIDRGVRHHNWPKPAGISLAGRRAGVVGYGDVGRAVAKRLQAIGMSVTAYDPHSPQTGPADVMRAAWPHGVADQDVLVLTASLNDGTRHMINADTLAQCKPGLRLVNVARGPLIEEPALCAALGSGQVHAAALDVFDTEPLTPMNPLRAFPQCIFGSHNGSNTVDAVNRASHKAIELLAQQIRQAA